jgi:uncharacterized LabA/DUF88 family protein
MSTIVFVDGENFLNKIKSVFDDSGYKWDDKKYGQIKLAKLVKRVLPELAKPEIKYYVAKLHAYKETQEKSEELIALQRTLKSNLTSQGVEFIVSGNVRMYSGGKDKSGKDKLLFKEKGVDVRLAVDAISLAADKKLKTAVICSSDSDMQPVVAELKRRKVKTIYLGFQKMPNRGLMYTCDETVLIRKSELKEFILDTYVLKINRFDEPAAKQRRTEQENVNKNQRITVK